MVEIWIGGKKLCEIIEDNPALENLERIIRKAGYGIKTEEKDGKIIKMIWGRRLNNSCAYIKLQIK